MLSAALAESFSLVSFPSGLVLDDRGQFAGFIMRRVTKAKPLFQLYKLVARKKHFPAADYRFLVHVARNLSVAVDSVHRSGCVIGDVNESGVLVTEAGKVALIDADSFQVEHGGQRYGCEVGKPEYTAPELQNRPLKKIVRTTSHDNFALAVIVFQLLWMGRHPFSGIYAKGEMPLERAIAESRFAYSVAGTNDMAPPPGALSLDMFPAEVGAMFERAFCGQAARPTAAEWARVLQRLRDGLKACGADKLHFYPATAHECPWCVSRRNGIETFLPPALAVGEVPTSDWSSGFDVVEVWRTIDRITAPPVALEPVFQLADPPPSALAKAARSKRLERKLVGVVALAAAVATIVLLAAFWPVWLALGGFGLARLFGDEDVPRFVKAFEVADREWADSVGRWQATVGAQRFLEAKEELAQAKRSFEGLAAAEKARLEEAQRNRREQQLKTWLEQFQIRRFRIKGIGTAKVATLASFGIETAAEVERGRLFRVPGFGPQSSQPLLDWRRRLEGRFVYDPRPNAADAQRVASILSNTATRAATLRLELSAGPAKLAAIAKAVALAQASPPADLRRLREIRLQAEVDLHHLGLPVPTARRIQAPAAPAVRPINQKRPNPTVRSQPSASSSAPSCPSCSSSMVRRTARRGYNAGNHFWGCSRYPRCTGTRSI
jgi:DNA-binding helix-hairpin-helix protein with protein kinase domain